MNMKKIILLLTFFNFFVTGPAAEAKITVDYKKQDVDYASYQELYVQNIDLRGMTFEIYDDDKRGFDTSELDDQKLNDLALELYDYFFINLKELIPINEGQDVNPEKKTLVLNIKLIGRFQSEDMGLINWMITKSKSAETTLTLECQLLDGQTKEELVTITDEHAFISPDHEKPLSSPEESELISDIFRVWATRFTRALDQLRQGKHVSE